MMEGMAGKSGVGITVSLNLWRDQSVFTVLIAVAKHRLVSTL